MQIDKVVIDTPALLSMISHCNTKCSVQGRIPTGPEVEVRGKITGVLKQEPGQTDASNLLINGTSPDTSKFTNKPLKAYIEEQTEGQKSSEQSSDIGFYVACELGMAFTQRNLFQAIACYRNFRNSILIVYDLNKSSYGFNPLKCYRLSQTAINALFLNDYSKLTSTLTQETINSQQLKLDHFFEEVDIKIHRSHLLQAFLFDHIQPQVPSFNTNMFQLGSNSNMLTHMVY